MIALASALGFLAGIAATLIAQAWRDTRAPRPLRIDARLPSARTVHLDGWRRR